VINATLDNEGFAVGDCDCAVVLWAGNIAKEESVICKCFSGQSMHTLSVSGSRSKGSLLQNLEGLKQEGWRNCASCCDVLMSVLLS
jgi:hypothetical protein